MPALQLTDYCDAYPHLRFERDAGILQLSLHTEGGSLRWGAAVHEELGYALGHVGADRENGVVILTGTGDAFCDDFEQGSFGEITPRQWDAVYANTKRLYHNLLALDVPVVGAVNGPATIHADLAVLSDVVLAADTAVFQDAPHFPAGLVPGDGVQVVWPALLGLNRGRYFLLTGQRLAAAQALDLGVVNEVLPRERLLDRAWELARQIAERPLLTRRYARAALVHDIRRRMAEAVSFGVALEGLAAIDHWPTGGE